MTANPPTTAADMTSTRKEHQESQPTIFDAQLEGFAVTIEVLSLEQFSALPGPDRGGYGVSRDKKSFMKIIPATEDRSSS